MQVHPRRPGCGLNKRPIPGKGQFRFHRTCLGRQKRLPAGTNNWPNFRLTGQKPALYQWLALQLRFAADKDSLANRFGGDSRVRLHSPNAPSRELLTGGAARDALGRGPRRARHRGRGLHDAIQDREIVARCSGVVATRSNARRLQIIANETMRFPPGPAVNSRRRSALVKAN